jgi:folate-binding protein YgfZ
MYYELSDLGFLKIQGADAKKMLQGQLTCNVESVAPLQGCMGAHCNPQGRIISLFYLFIYQDCYYLMLPHSMIALTLAALKKYAVFFKADLTDASNSMAAIGSTEPLPTIITAEQPAVIRISQGTSRCIIAGTKETIQHIREVPANAPAITNSDAWKYLDLTDKIPSIYPETSGKFLPHEINLDKLGAISFDKGCYTGQEIIARMHYRGKLKNHLYMALITSATPPSPGQDIYTEINAEARPCGVIVDICRQAYNVYNCLILTDTGSAEKECLYLDADKNVTISISGTQSK